MRNSSSIISRSSTSLHISTIKSEMGFVRLRTRSNGKLMRKEMNNLFRCKRKRFTFDFCFVKNTLREKKLIFALSMRATFVQGTSVSTKRHSVRFNCNRYIPITKMNSLKFQTKIIRGSSIIKHSRTALSNTLFVGLPPCFRSTAPWRIPRHHRTRSSNGLIIGATCC